jgi:hypothetical protein
MLPAVLVNFAASSQFTSLAIMHTATGTYEQDFPR